VRHACVSPDRRGFASGAKTRVAYWPELSSEAPKLFALKAVVRDIAFSPRGLLVGFGDDGLVELDLETGAELRSIDPGGIVFKVRVSPDGRWLFVAVDSKVKNTMTRLRLLNYETGEFVDDANFLEQPRMAFADTGATVAVGHFTRVEIRAYGEEGFSDKRLLAGRDVAPLSSRSAFATLAVMGAIAHSYTVQELAYWNGRVYSIADADADAKGKGRAKGKGELRVWDVATGEELWVIAFAKAEPRRLSVGPDGVLIFMSDDTIHLYPAD
jgi:hypothetical protein